MLITGAGGSIGAELVRQVSAFVPAKLVLLGASEFNLYTIDQEVHDRFLALTAPAVIADVRDRERITRLLAEFRPQVVFHAAALKHVPLVEANPLEGIATNVLSTANVADACVAAGTAAMVLISTDKAVNPTSVMGASKRLAEMYCQAMDVRRGGSDGTRFLTVRFGNVLGSTGSVVPLFQKQIARGGPVTVTDPEMRRYFMTIREAVELVLQASALGLREVMHEGKIFVLDMGEPVKIVDLARQMIRLAGLRPEIDVAITFTGARPGEKLYEETIHGGEPTVPTECAGILLAAPRPGDLRELGRSVKTISKAFSGSDRASAMAVLRRMVPEYGPADETPTRAAAG